MPRAILSLYDKSNLVPFAKALAGLGYELVASGGTARALTKAGLAVTKVADVTGHPEILGGRVKTLHPAVHGGILARRTEEHLADLKSHGIEPVDVVACNLYPFIKTVESGASESETVEEIDIGGVTLLRAAAKNFESVAVVCDPADYDGLAAELKEGLTPQKRRKLALKAFRHTAAYDAAIASWLDKQCDPDSALPGTIHIAAERVDTLRYGENPHQQAATYRPVHQAPAYEQIAGAKQLSYNNIVDLEAAWDMAQDFERPAVAIIKHTNPAGLAVGETPLEAFEKALACDPVSAFGSIIACNRPLDVDFIEAWGKLFVEVVMAPSFTDAALARLRKRKKNCRVLVPRADQPLKWVMRNTRDGLLVQTADDRGADTANWKVASKRQPTAAEMDDLAFAWVTAKHVKSNAIVFAKGGATVGVGPGQPNRVESVRIAARNAGENAVGAVLASDAFFPFADGIEAAAEAGITAVAQPGGSIRDDEVIAKVDALGLAMIFTGDRHFRH